MSDKINKLLDEIKAEAKQNAMDTIAREMVESAPGMWEAIKKRCGEKEAALAVMCLLQEAVEDGVIVATKFSNPADEDDEATVTLRMTVIDETATMIEGTGGICIEVAKKSNGEVRGASRLAGEASSAEGATSTVVLCGGDDDR